MNLRKDPFVLLIVNKMNKVDSKKRSTELFIKMDSKKRYT